MNKFNKRQVWCGIKIYKELDLDVELKMIGQYEISKGTVTNSRHYFLKVKPHPVPNETNNSTSTASVPRVIFTVLFCYLFNSCISATKG
jgi:hypothetical protein